MLLYFHFITHHLICNIGFLLISQLHFVHTRSRCFRYGARIRIYGRPVPYANWATRCPRFRRSSALCACRFRQLFFHELITRASPRLRTRVTCLFGWYAVKLALNSTRASNPDAQSAPLYKRFRTTEALYENIKSPRDGNSERDEWFFSTF